MDVRTLMKVESLRKEGDRIIATTTGARFEINTAGENGTISCFQLINGERHVVTLTFDHTFSTLSVEHQDENTCVFHQGTGGCSSTYGCR